MTPETNDWDFSVAETQGYLMVEVQAGHSSVGESSQGSASGEGTWTRAGDRVRRCRAHCRERNLSCVTVLVDGDRFHIEMHRTGELVFYHPELGNEWAGGPFPLRALKRSEFERAFPLCMRFVELAREASLEAKLPSLPPAPVGQPNRFATGTLSRAVFTVPIRRVHLPQEEYLVLSAALRHLFGSDVVELGSLLFPAEARGGHRFARMTDETLRAWKTLPRHLFALEDRFEGINIVLSESLEMDMQFCSRPAIAANQAIVVTHNLRFCGALLLERVEGVWQVVGQSWDEDWSQTLADPYTVRFDREDFNRLAPDWREISVAYPAANQTWDADFPSLLYDQLADGTAPDHLLDRACISMVDGQLWSCRQLLELPEVLWEDNESDWTRALAESGLATVLLREHELHSCKLLAHWRKPCWRASRDWLQPEPLEESEFRRAVEALFERIADRAGFSHLRFSLSKEQMIYFQPTGKTVCPRQGPSQPWKDTGRLWLSGIREEHDLPRSLVTLLRWGDPGPEIRQRFWEAAVLEFKRLGQRYW